MKSVLLLTKSPMSEQALEQQLQCLDCEVYTSRNTLDRYLSGDGNPRFVNNFDIVLLSDTVSKNEMAQLIPELNDSHAFIFRRADASLSEEEKRSWSKYSNFYWINQENSLEELRELIDQTGVRGHRLSSGTNIVPLNWKQEKELSKFVLSTNERKLLILLYQANGTVLSREHLSLALWNQPKSNSTMAQLSTITNRLRLKLANQGVIGDTIVTVWGFGYKLTDEFYDQVSYREPVLDEM
ncbi:winged helix-turn-helix domain-containing protein [Candidatus Enterococcus murrayae]|uniref:Winged helix-turn-helix domain-containing protein n=1 Tax=Candidatus Enterococcus murrayae TaxID=2815321 RepID=A0ABS3HDA6_9ENTE|nr:helix-turn-helix domain-containing protein [Enterococcus sp. MJM16]MBO0451178.1 winged helix-turn-helix domain-containing protein [Enterococcus sp. MJM16]